MKLKLTPSFEGANIIPVNLEGDQIGLINPARSVLLTCAANGSQVLEGLEIPTFIRKAAR